MRESLRRRPSKIGDDGPLPGDIELADPMSPTRLSRAGKRVSWEAALAGGEHWAAKYCRQIALAARARQALEQGRVSAADAVAATKLIAERSCRVRDRLFPRPWPRWFFWPCLCRRSSWILRSARSRISHARRP